jgi:hypothetical protein
VLSRDQIMDALKGHPPSQRCPFRLGLVVDLQLQTLCVPCSKKDKVQQLARQLLARGGGPKKAWLSLIGLVVSLTAACPAALTETREMAWAADPWQLHQWVPLTNATRKELALWARFPKKFRQYAFVNPPKAYGVSTDAAERWAGAGRYDTMKAVADSAAARGWIDFEHVGIASGANFPDALAGAAEAGRAGGPVLLSLPYVMPDQAAAVLRGNAASVAAVRVYGSEAALEGAVVLGARWTSDH